MLSPELKVDFRELGIQTTHRVIWLGQDGVGLDDL